MGRGLRKAARMGRFYRGGPKSDVEAGARTGPDDVFARSRAAMICYISYWRRFGGQSLLNFSGLSPFVSQIGPLLFALWSTLLPLC